MLIKLHDPNDAHEETDKITNVTSMCLGLNVFDPTYCKNGEIKYAEHINKSNISRISLISLKHLKVSNHKKVLSLDNKNRTQLKFGIDQHIRATFYIFQ